MKSDIDPREISAWIQGIQHGEKTGLDEAWNRLFEKLVTFVERRTDGIPVTKADPEEIAASVFESAWRASQEGRLSSIKSCDELWWWLLRTARFKTVDHIRRAKKLTTGGQNVHVSLDDIALFLISDSQDPAFLAAMQEEYARGLSMLPDDLSRSITVMRMEGHSTQEIVDHLGVSPATVARKLALIRDLWSREM